MDDETLGRVVDAQCALIGLTLDAAHRPGVLQYLRLVAGIAPRVMDFPLAVHDESGSVFVPVEPPGGEGAGG